MIIRQQRVMPMQKDNTSEGELEGKLYVIEDNSSKKMNECKLSDGFAEKIVNKTLKQLKKEGVFVFPEQLEFAKDISEEQMILKSINEEYRCSNIMGFLGYGKERLVIRSRFSNGENDYLFQYLLGKVLDCPNILELHTDANLDNHQFNLLLFLFPYYLKLAMRKGLFKTYIRNQYNDGNVKGTIDIKRHIKCNIPFIGKIAYNQREFSYDNYLTEIIRHTIEFIKSKPYGRNLLRKVKSEVDSIVQSTQKYEYYNRRKIIIENKKNPIRHAFYYEYQKLQRLCIMILQYHQHGIGSGALQINGILFDGAWLWEEYINTLIGDKFYHPMNKSKDNTQHLFSKENGHKVGDIYPDFISKDNENRIIADAKYKPIDNVKNKDYLQVLAYMLRFESKKGFYLYPEVDSAQNQQVLKLNSGTGYEKNIKPREDISVIKLGLKIPNSEGSYEDFVSKIQQSEKTFVAEFMKFS